jgi:hypothetical protein
MPSSANGGGQIVIDNVRLEAVRRPGRFSPAVLFRTLSGAAYSTSRHLSGACRRAVRAVVQEWRPDLVQIEPFAMANYVHDVADGP